MCTQFLAENVFLRDTVKIETIYADSENGSVRKKGEKKYNGTPCLGSEQEVNESTESGVDLWMNDLTCTVKYVKCMESSAF